MNWLIIIINFQVKKLVKTKETEMTKLNNIFLLDNENEIGVLNVLKDHETTYTTSKDFGFNFMNDSVINISYPNYMFKELNRIVIEYKYCNDYNLTKEEINTLESILIKINK